MDSRLLRPDIFPAHGYLYELLQRSAARRRGEREHFEPSVLGFGEICPHGGT
jgi:hypothetical protein